MAKRVAVVLNSCSRAACIALAFDYSPRRRNYFHLLFPSPFGCAVRILVRILNPTRESEKHGRNST